MDSVADLLSILEKQTELVKSMSQNSENDISSSNIVNPPNKERPNLSSGEKKRTLEPSSDTIL